MPPLAVITGASAGLGAEFSRQLHSQGHDVVLVARRRERLEALCAELNLARSNSARHLPLDLSAASQCLELEEFLRREAVTVLVNNAGFGTAGAFAESEIDRQSEMVRLNVTCQLRLCHAVIPGLKNRGGGCIINLSSIAGFQPLPFMSTYAATKAFDLFHSVGLYHELKPHGIKVLAVCPGPTETEFRQVSGMPVSLGGGGNATAQQVVSESLLALRRGKAMVVPGSKAKLMSLASRIVPLVLSSSWMARLLSRHLRPLPN